MDAELRENLEGDQVVSSKRKSHMSRPAGPEQQTHKSPKGRHESRGVSPMRVLRNRLIPYERFISCFYSSSIHSICCGHQN